MAKSIMGKSIHSLLFQLLGQGSAIVTGIVLARALGPSGKGYVGYAAVALSTATVFFDGQSEAIAYQIGRRGLPLRRVLLATIRLLALLIPPLMLLFGAISYLRPDQAVLWACAVALPVALVGQMCVPYFIVTDYVKTANYQALLTSTVYLTGIAVVVLSGHASAGVILWLWIASLATSSSFGVWRLLSVLRTLPQAPTAGEAQAAPGGDAALEPVAPDLPIAQITRDQFVFMSKSGLAAIAGYLNLRIDAFIVSAMLGTSEFGIYTLGIASGELMWKIATAITWSSLGRIATDPQPESARLVAKVTRHIFTLQLIGGLFAFFIGPVLIPIIYGPAFARAGDALRVLLPGLVAYTMEGALGYYLTVQMGLPLVRMMIQVGSIALCALISILAIPHFSIVGAALGTTVSYLFVVTVVSGIFLRATGLPVWDLFILKADEVDRIRTMVLKYLGFPVIDPQAVQGASSET